MLHALLAIFVSVAGADSAPFWKAKEKAYSRVENGEILVSVHSEKPLMAINGGGQVRAPRDFVYNFAKDFNHIENLGVYVDHSHYDAEAGTVALSMSALGKHAEFLVRVQSFDDEDPRRIAFTITQGPLSGLHADLTFRTLTAPAKSEVGIHGEYRYTDQALYKFLLEMGMEMVFRRMAERLRDQVQAAYRAAVPK
jgi:hypothetical protein